MPLTFDNAHSAKRYALLNAKLGYRRDLPRAFKVDLSFGVKNITNSTYYTMVFLNQTYAPLPAPQPQVYLPGPGTTVYGGVNVSKAF
jgi:iron complex outermembrane receptor protein